MPEPKKDDKKEKKGGRIGLKAVLFITAIIVGAIVVGDYFDSKDKSVVSAPSSKPQPPGYVQAAPQQPITYPTEANPATVLVGVGINVHRIPFQIPDNMRLAMSSWNNETFRYKDESWNDWVTVTPGHSENDRKTVNVIIESTIGRPMYVKYYLIPKRI